MVYFSAEFHYFSLYIMKEIHTNLFSSNISYSICLKLKFHFKQNSNAKFLSVSKKYYSLPIVA